MAEALIYPLGTAVDSTQKQTLGQLSKDSQGNENIYLQGVANTAVGSAVTFNPGTFATTLFAPAAAGRVAFALAAVGANQFGWYCVKGVAPCVTASATVVGAAVFGSGSAGQVDDAVVATDRIENAYFATTTTPAGKVNIVYPQAIALG